MYQFVKQAVLYFIIYKIATAITSFKSIFLHAKHRFCIVFHKLSQVLHLLSQKVFFYLVCLTQQLKQSFNSFSLFFNKIESYLNVIFSPFKFDISSFNGVHQVFKQNFHLSFILVSKNYFLCLVFKQFILITYPIFQKIV